jgi:antitoxin component HigA of HigAB toxin-antitoxin module
VSKAKPISTQADYEAALARIEALMGATPEAELAILVELVDEYERTHLPMVTE